MKLIQKAELFNSDDYVNYGEAGYIEHYDFSQANLSKENRVKAVSKVASVCYGNDGLKPNFNLYNKLERESIGLPSSSFEFVPILLIEEQTLILYSLFAKLAEYKIDLPLSKEYNLNITKYGYSFVYNDTPYVLTNLRALLYDLEFLKGYEEYLKRHIDVEFFNPDNEIWFNDEEECEIIKQHYFTFKVKATIRDFRQLLRHRNCSVQELSRRYTTGNKVELEFRFTKSVANSVKNLSDTVNTITDNYYKMLENGVKAEEARDMLPVSLYSFVWLAYYPTGFTNMLELRTKSSAQREIREIANKMKEFSKKY